MVDLAVLGIKVQTKGARESKRRLSDLSREAERSERSVRRFSSSMDGAGRTFATFGRALAGGFLAGGIASLPTVMSRVTASVAELVDVSSKIGVATDALQELEFAGSTVSIRAATLRMGLQRLSRRVAESAQDTGELNDTLKQYNISARDANGNTRSTVDVLGDLADAVQNAESEQEQLRIAFKAFDSEGATMVNILKQGRAGLNELREAARQAGAVMDQETLAAAKRLDAQFNVLTKSVTTFGKSLLVNLADGFSAFGEAFTDTFYGPQGMANPELEVRIQRLTSALEEYRKRGLDTTIVLRQLAAAQAELNRRQAEPFSATDGPSNIGRPRPVNFPRPRARPDTEEFYNQIIGVQEDRLKSLNRERERATMLAERQAEKTQAVVEALKFEASQLGLSNEQQRINSELRRANVSATSAQGQEIARLVTQIEQEEQRLDRMKQAQDRARQSLDQLTSSIGDFVSGADRSTESIIRMGVQLVQLAARANASGGTISGDGFDIGSLFGQASPTFR